MSGRASRQKGKAGEREVAKAFRDIYGDGVKRGWQARDGADAPDVDGTPWFIECKRWKVILPSDVQNAYQQALDAKAKSGDPRPALVLARQDHRDWHVYLAHQDLLDLAGASARVPHALVSMTFEDFLVLLRHLRPPVISPEDDL